MTKRKGGAPVIAAIALLGDLALEVERHERTYKELLRLCKDNDEIPNLSEVERAKFERRGIQLLNKSDTLQDRAYNVEAAHLRAFEMVNTTAAKNSIPLAVREAIAKTCDELLRFSQEMEQAHLKWLRAGFTSKPSSPIGGAP
jgi:hypothetical protein